MIGSVSNVWTTRGVDVTSFSALTAVRFIPLRGRINGDALFVTNGRSFDGHSGGAFANYNGGVAMYDVMSHYGVLLWHAWCTVV